jgi:type III pantothenate kinase
MPALLFDIGNTRTKVALLASNKLTLLYNGTHNIQENKIDTWIKRHKPDVLFISNVNKLKLPFIKYAAVHIKTVKWGKQLSMPYQNKYTGKTLGQDRMAMAAAAMALFPGENVLVISCGTCITYDFVNHKKEYLGGAISPGMQMRFKALHEMTARLPLIKNYSVGNILGNSTQESIQSGVMNGIVGEINYAIQHYRKIYGNIKIILSGGDARYFEPHLNYKIFATENLVLQGLQRILKHNYPTLV